jgi:uncharacterized protein involved in exopolysaccharide biosynthesis
MTSLRSTAVPEVEPLVEFSPNGSGGHAASSLIDCAVLLWRRRRFLGRVAALGGVLTFLVVLIVPNRYESTTQLMPPDMRGSASEALMTGLLNRAGGNLTGLTADLLGVDNKGAILVGVLHSRSVADSLIQRFNLKKVYRDRREQDARDDLADRTNIFEDRKSGIITISVEDRDRQRAAAMASAYVDELNRLLADVNTSSAHRERVFIEDRLQGVKAALDQASKQLSDFSSKNVTLDPKEQGRAIVEAAVTLQGELIAAETQLHGLEPIYSDGNIRIQSLKARIAELRRQIQELRGSDANGAPANGDDPSYPSFRQLPTLGVTYADLYREVKLREVVFETLTQQYEMAKIAEAKEIPSVKVLDSANVPEKKSGPHRALLTVLGMVVFFSFGSLFVIGEAAWQRVDPGDPRKNLAAEVWDDTLSARTEWMTRAQKIKARLGRHSSNGNSASHHDSEDGN